MLYVLRKWVENRVEDPIVASTIIDELDTSLSYYEAKEEINEKYHLEPTHFYPQEEAWKAYREWVLEATHLEVFAYVKRGYRVLLLQWCRRKELVAERMPYGYVKVIVPLFRADEIPELAKLGARLKSVKLVKPSPFA